MQRDRTGLRTLRVVADGEKFPFTPHVAVAIPLMRAQTTVGVLTVWSADVIDQTAISALETIAPYAAVQVVHARELVLMRFLAERDALTGLYNRRSFDQQMDAEIARFERYHRPFSVIMMDLDFFKKVNDQYGHDAGDDVLRTVGGIIASSLRDVDIAARVGGEEFALLLPETDKAAAVEIAERIRRRIETTEITAAGHRLQVTSSAGVMAVPANASDVGNVMRAADQLLYEAKRLGRNRVVS
jgi:diguanylate cyclase (GGDEF)-like protein